MIENSLYAKNERKYLNSEESAAFTEAIARCDEQYRVLFEILYMTGCRVSEALALTRGNFDFTENIICLRTLKRRHGREDYRRIPVPEWFMKRISCYVASLELKDDLEQIWKIHRTTVWRRIKLVMAKAEVSGSQATCKGLRHAFGVLAMRQGVPLPVLKKWLGHSSIENTEIYLNVVGDEEREYVERMHTRLQT